MNYSQFTNIYPISKTLCFKLIPQGQTFENIKKNGILTEDENRAKNFKAAKEIIDDYHRQHIEHSLENVHLSGVEEYADLYAKNKSEELEKKAEELRIQIVEFLTTPKEDFKRLTSKELIKEDLPKWVKGDSEKEEIINQFANFTTYFAKFYENRKNIYSKEAKSTAIPYRIINQNLPKFIDNHNILQKILADNKLSNQIADLEKCFSEHLNGKTIGEFFSIENYSCFLSQSAIDKYNTIIGGITEDEKIKIKGINEIINLYNQQNKKEKIGLMMPLFKQILSKKQSFSFIPEQFNTDEELLISIKELKNNVSECVNGIQALFNNLNCYNTANIYISNDGGLEEVSKNVYGQWDYVKNKIRDEYDSNYNKKVKNYEAYAKKREKSIKGIKYFSLDYIIDLCDDKAVIDYYENMEIKDTDGNKASIFELIKEKEKTLSAFLEKEYPADRSLANDEKSVEIIKNYLDAIKILQKLIKPFKIPNEEVVKDDAFYSEYTIRSEELDLVTPIYDKTRNYVTRKPYSTEKIKLNFGNSTLMHGWDVSKESTNAAIILKKSGKYYLGIMNKGNSRVFENIEESNGRNVYQKMEYKTIPGAYKMLPKVFFSKANIEYFNPSDTLVENYKKGTHKKGENFVLKDCHELIDFYKKSIDMHPEWKKYNFKFSNTKDYKDISEFYAEVDAQGYKISFKNIDVSVIDSLVDEGKLYLFQIYNKDYSAYSKGTPNLHTLYWEMIFDDRNLKNVIYKLNGNAEIYYRKASINKKDAIVHKAGFPIKTKNEFNKKQEVTFDYDIVKNYRYTVDQFQFHVPITINANSSGLININHKVNNALKDNNNNYIIGIDRGERNLLYVCVIDPKGNIIEQRSLNSIVSKYNGVDCKTDYHKLLDDKEKRRDEQRKSWKSIENIKELKEGYLSQAIHVITALAIKYNAIIVMEDLNRGFLRGRQKIEKQVYQKFERMLIEKLNYMADKKAVPEECGGILSAYQLSNKFESYKKLGKQSGIVFYTQAWGTSKIDPVTGFFNFFSLKFKSIKETKMFWEKFESICFDEKLNMFSFRFNYSNFTKKTEGTKEDWIIYTNGERIKTKKNKNSVWESETIDLTESMIELFKNYSIDYYKDDIKDDIAAIDAKDFHVKLLDLFKLTLQMRNSKSNSTDPSDDYIISPVMNDKGKFYDSRFVNEELPTDADANGAYNIARKGLLMLDIIKNTPVEELKNVKLDIHNKEWLQYSQGV